jgi:hypothetical protein
MRTSIAADPDHFGKPDLDPHQNERQDPDPHESQKSDPVSDSHRGKNSGAVEV